MTLQEGPALELKERVTDSAMPPISAFANFGDGSIAFGYDDGCAVGLPDVKKARLSIEKKIKDTMEPIPDYSLEEGSDPGTLVLHVRKGEHGPYLYRGAAYKRVDTASVRLGPWELTELTRSMSPKPFGLERCREQDFTFDVLQTTYARCPGVRLSQEDVCKTLGLGLPGSYNNTAAILADHSPMPGADIVLFGDNANTIRDRQTVSGVSALTLLDRATEARRAAYDAEVVDGLQRHTVQGIPALAFREAVVNALAHRDWTVPAPIAIQLHPDHALVVSPGPLPSGVTPEDYVEGDISVLRNETLAVAFLQMKYLEHLGGGARRMREAYQGTGLGPSFRFTDGSVRVTLPVVRAGAEQPDTLLALFASGATRTRADIQHALGISQAAANQRLRGLVEAGVLQKVGAGPSTAYRLA